MDHSTALFKAFDYRDIDALGNFRMHDNATAVAF